MNNYIKGLNYKEGHPFRTDAERTAEKFDTDTTITNGVVRWNTNDRVPPADILEFWAHLGKEFDLEKSEQARKEETNAFLNEYRKQQEGQEVSAEQRAEARAAFGPGVVVVDAISGRKFTT